MILHTLAGNHFPNLLMILTLVCYSGSVFALPIVNSPGTSQDQIFDNTIEQIQAEGLRQALSINKELSLQVSAIARQSKQTRAMLDERYKKQIAELKRAIETSNETGLANHLSQIEETTRAIQALHMQKWQSLKALLTVKQQARYLLYQDALQRELQRRAIKGLQPGASDK